MSETIGVLKTIPKGSKRPDLFGTEANQLVKNKIGWSEKFFVDADYDKIQKEMDKKGSSAEYCISFDGGLIQFFVRVGTTKLITKDSVKLSSFKDHTLRFKIMDGLLAYKGATSTQVNDFKDRDPLD